MERKVVIYHMPTRLSTDAVNRTTNVKTNTEYAEIHTTASGVNVGERGRDYRQPPFPITPVTLSLDRGVLAMVPLSLIA